jgi:hypothetical protein
MEDGLDWLRIVSISMAAEELFILPINSGAGIDQSV